MEKSAQALEEKLAALVNKINETKKAADQEAAVEKMEVEETVKPEEKPESTEENKENSNAKDIEVIDENPAVKTEPDVLEDSFDDQIQVLETINTKKIGTS